MTKISEPPVLKKESMPDAPDADWFDRFLDHSNNFNEPVARALSRGLTRKDNTPYPTQKYLLQHGMETEITPPLPDGLNCAGVFAMQCEGVSLDGAGKPDGSVYSLSLVSLNWRPSGKATGSVYVTANYDLKHTEPCFIASGAAKSIPSGGADTLFDDWSTVYVNRGGVISQSSGTFTVSEAGLYVAILKIRFPGGVTYIGTNAIVKPLSGTDTPSATSGALNGIKTGDLYWDITNQNQGPYMTVAAPMPLQAGGTFGTYAFQTNGASSPRVIAAGPDARTLAVYRQFNTSAPTGRLNLFFYGE